MADIELTPSVPKTETPSEEPKIPPAEEPKDPPAAATPTLYKLPDGREVDADGLRAEYENLLPEFTRKSQELAELKSGGKQDINNLPEWKKEGYVPKSYAEIVELGKQEAIAEITRTQQAEAERAAGITAKVEADVAALKAKDPKLDENALFMHANRYGFRDLKMAYENMQEIKRVATVTEDRVLSGVKKKNDPIATGSGAGSSAAIHYAPATSATEFLSRLKK